MHSNWSILYVWSIYIITSYSPIWLFWCCLSIFHGLSRIISMSSCNLSVISVQKIVHCIFHIFILAFPISIYIGIILNIYSIVISISSVFLSSSWSICIPNIWSQSFSWCTSWSIIKKSLLCKLIYWSLNLYSAITVKSRLNCSQ